MKKIGILYGRERSFPMAVIERINSKGISEIIAEPVRIDKAMQGEKLSEFGTAHIVDYKHRVEKAFFSINSF